MIQHIPNRVSVIGRTDVVAEIRLVVLVRDLHELKHFILKRQRCVSGDTPIAFRRSGLYVIKHMRNRLIEKVVAEKCEVGHFSVAK
jgi:hypothetical protein